MSEEGDQARSKGAGSPGDEAEGGKKPESDLEKAKADVKDAASDAREKAGQVADKLRDEETRKKVRDVAGKLRGRLRR
jgi:hypothetical protein